MNAIDTALYSTLTGGTALTALLGGTANCYHQIVPGTASYPVVIWQLQGGGDANETPRRRKDVLYTVKAISDVSARSAGEVDAQIDLLLHGQTLTVSGWTNYWLARETDIEYTETTPEGRRYWHQGAIYRMRLCK